MRLAIVGSGRHGKDTVCEWFAANTILKYSFSTSWPICEEIARRSGRPVDEVHKYRHLDRATMRRVGDELRSTDSAYLAKRTLENGNLCNGIRAQVEIEAVQRLGLVDLTIWIDASERITEPDPTLEFGPEVADIFISNNGSRNALDVRLERLARCLDVLAW